MPFEIPKLPAGKFTDSPLELPSPFAPSPKTQEERATAESLKALAVSSSSARREPTSHRAHPYRRQIMRQRLIEPKSEAKLHRRDWEKIYHFDKSCRRHTDLFKLFEENDKLLEGREKLSEEDLGDLCVQFTLDSKTSWRKEEFTHPDTQKALADMLERFSLSFKYKPWTSLNAIDNATRFGIAAIEWGTPEDWGNPEVQAEGLDLVNNLVKKYSHDDYWYGKIKSSVEKAFLQPDSGWNEDMQKLAKKTVDVCNSLKTFDLPALFELDQ